MMVEYEFRCPDCSASVVERRTLGEIEPPRCSACDRIMRRQFTSPYLGIPRQPRKKIDAEGHGITELVRDSDGVTNGWTTTHDDHQDAQVFVDAPAFGGAPTAQPTVRT